MGPLYDPARHEPLAGVEWSPPRVRDAVAAICRDAEAAFDRDRLWPMHPRGRGARHAGGRDPPRALRRRRRHAARARAARRGGPARADARRRGDRRGPPRSGAGVAGRRGRRRVAAGRLERDPARRAPPRALGGDRGRRSRTRSPPTWSTRRTSCCSVRPARCSPRARCTRARARSASRSCGARARARCSRARRRTACGRRTSTAAGARYVGAAHGFAGNVLALRGAPEWLDDARGRRGAGGRDGARVRDRRRRPRELAARCRAARRTGAPPRVQWCHGAPGIVTSLAALAPGDDAHGALLAAGGELVWRAGPARGERRASATARPATASRSWRCSTGRATSAGSSAPARSRCTPSSRSQRLRAPTGRGRYSLFTGDVGAALLAAACLTGDAAFPGIDDL